MSLIMVRDKSPILGKNVFVAPSAQIIGNVTLGDECSVWFNTTLRGDVMPIVIGDKTNIQDGSVLHGTYGKWSCILEEKVTVGHSVVLHGCRIGSSSLIGMGSIIMDGAEIGDHCVVGAGSLVTEGKKFERYSLILGRPAVFKRKLNDEEVGFLEQSAQNYVLYKSWYKN